MESQQVSEMVLRKTVTVELPVEAAFRLYTEGIARWWPLQKFSVGEEDSDAVVLEPRKGGRLYERTKSGEEHAWGTVLGWDPPRRLVHTWHPGREPESAQQVEITFEQEGAGTRVELVHTGWEKLGDRAPEAFTNYEGGWDIVLGRYSQTADERS
jgi:uncharacterized protein YndB with AHSA1/START domain